MVNSLSLSQYFLPFLCFIHLQVLSYGGGFTVDLIHRDSPLSPIYDASKTSSDRVKRALHVSKSRAGFFRELSSKSTGNSQVQLVSDGGAYMMVASIGTPPTPFYGEIDTGSDLIWTQCLHCIHCYNQSVPFFDPTKSSTYSSMNCSSPTCREPPFLCSSDNSCSYLVTYGDRSYSFGDVGVDTFTFGSTSVPSLIFGCGHSDGGTFTNPSTGVIGLGGGNISFASQMNDSINGKFSYCFVKYDPSSNVTGKISFGDDSLLSGPGVVSTPLVHGYKDNRYHLTLNSVKIGDNTFPYPDLKDGNVIIDSGLSITLLPSSLVSSIENQLKQTTKGSPIPDPERDFSLCYNSNTTEFDGAPFTFEFTGAVLVIPQSNVLIETDGVLCLNIIPSFIPFGIFGNMFQVNFQVGYDLIGKTVSFKQRNCSQL